MSDWWPMLLFLAALFAGTLVLLVCGFVNIQAERDQASARRAGDDERKDRSEPSFFGASFAGLLADPGEPSHNGLEGTLRGYLEREEREVARFVSRPSLESLYRASSRPVVAKDLRRYLERELQYAAGFIADPSVESLYRRSGEPARSTD